MSESNTCHDCGGFKPTPGQNVGINPEALCHCCQCLRCVGAKRLVSFVRDDALTTSELLADLQKTNDLKSSLTTAFQQGMETAIAKIEQTAHGYDHITSPTIEQEHCMSDSHYFADGWRLACQNAIQAIRTAAKENR